MQNKPLSDLDEDTILENGGLVPHLMQSRFDFNNGKGTVVQIKKKKDNRDNKSKSKR
jgi:hypothetical protein